MSPVNGVTRLSSCFNATQGFLAIPTSLIVCVVMVAVLLTSCNVLSPSDAAVQVADQFYDAMSRGDFHEAVQMCGRKMLEETPPNVMVDQLARRHDQLGTLVSRERASVFMSDVYGSDPSGTLTKFQFSCKYSNARTREELKVFEPADGGKPYIYSYRFEDGRATGSAL